MTMPVARFPFVSRADILRAYRPGAEPSERTFRTLREHGLVSGGVAIRHRRRGRVVGQLRCYAALNVDAVVLARHERTEEAAYVASTAGQFEVEWQPLVAELATQFDFYDFETFRSARNTLAHALAPATEQLERLHVQLGAAVGALVSEDFVRIGEITEQWAALHLVTPRSVVALNEAFRSRLNDTVAALISECRPRIDSGIGTAIAAALEPFTRDTRQLVIDSFLPLAASLATGDLALLRIEHGAGSSLVSLLAAVQQDEPFVLDDEFAPYFSDEPLPASVIEQVEQRRAEGDTVVVPALTIPLTT